MPTTQRARPALARAVALAEEIDAAGGLPALPWGDPRRRRFIYAVVRLAGLERPPEGLRYTYTGASHVARYEAAALATYAEMIRRRAMRDAVARVQRVLDIEAAAAARAADDGSPS
ncbi:hypothetical protein [Parafrankia sp. FMc2]|uniref:hypothetical protein n=1 Tax=Parafrankia sp. FMc2 TaxID=3233196 RepID=UPI0034D681CC